LNRQDAKCAKVSFWRERNAEARRARRGFAEFGKSGRNWWEPLRQPVGESATDCTDFTGGRSEGLELETGFCDLTKNSPRFPLAFFASWSFDETNPGSKTATSHPLSSIHDPLSSIHDLKKVTPPAPAGVPAGRGRVVRGMSKSGTKRRGGQRNEIRWRLGGIGGLESRWHVRQSGENDKRECTC
jgi:hypothetical protein